MGRARRDMLAVKLLNWEPEEKGGFREVKRSIVRIRRCGVEWKDAEERPVGSDRS
jgi:hypothetical protein